MNRSGRSDPQKKSFVTRIRRWIRKKSRERAIRAEERQITKKLEAKARAREIRELSKTSPENEPTLPVINTQPANSRPAATAAPDSASGEEIPTLPPKPLAPPSPIPLRGVFPHWRKYSEVRKAVLQQKRLEREARRQAALKAQGREKKSAFAVGSTDMSASDVRIPYRQRPIYLIRRTARKLVRERIPHWVAAMVPALFAGLVLVAPAVIDASGHAAVAVPEYRQRWAEAFRVGRWNEAEMAGRRVISSRLYSTQDQLAYFDTLVANGEFEKAVRQLLARESEQREFSIAEFRFDMADRFLTKLDGSPELSELTLRKLGESLAGPLPQEKQIKARKILASAAAVQGDLISAIAILSPIGRLDPISRSDLLWLNWNVNPSILGEIYRQDIREVLDEIASRDDGQSDIDPQDVAARARLSCLLGQENRFLAWVESNSRLTPDEKSRWIREINNLSLVKTLRTEPLDPELAWTKLRPILEKEPDNPEMVDTAIGLGIGQPDLTSPEAMRWVMEKLRSDSTDKSTLARISMSAHAAGQWPLAIESYQRLTKIDPENPIALNNLAGLYYKFPPYRIEEALKISEQAVGIEPENLGFLETKGQILARLGRIGEARSILEGCLAAFPEEWNLHNTLAQIYEYEGKAPLAAIHREKLARLKKPANAPAESRIVFPDRKARPEPSGTP